MISSERYCVSCGAANAPAAEVCFACGLSLKITAPLSIDQHLLHDRYRILAQVGKGGFSAVYRAEDTLFNNHLVAIKAITLSGLKPSEVIEATDAFNREILLLSGLKHPNVPRIYNNFADAECWYLVMDFIEGITLEKHLETMQDGRLPLGEVFELGLLLCSVLEYLHTRQPAVIFRDLKPANVMLTLNGRVALIDFGIARHFKPGQAKDTMPFGSPGYAAPEQYGKAQTTTRTDIYGLGVVLHQLLTGDDPAQTPFHFAALQLKDQSVLNELEQLIMRMVEMDAAKRPASITTVKQELQRMASAWSMQQVYGMQAQAPLSSGRPPVSWQSLQPPLSRGYSGLTIMVNTSRNAQRATNAGQMSSLQQTVPIPGIRGSSTGHWGQTPLKKHNGMAIASLIFGFISIFVPVLACMFSSALTYSIGEGNSPLTYLLPAFIMLAPAFMAVIFGHIGCHRAKTVAGLAMSKDIAVTGMVIGYVFGSIYMGAICLILMFFSAAWR